MKPDDMSHGGGFTKDGPLPLATKEDEIFTVEGATDWKSIYEAINHAGRIPASDGEISAKEQLDLIGKFRRGEITADDITSRGGLREAVTAVKKRELFVGLRPFEDGKLTSSDDTIEKMISLGRGFLSLGSSVTLGDIQLGLRLLKKGEVFLKGKAYDLTKRSEYNEIKAKLEALNR